MYFLYSHLWHFSPFFSQKVREKGTEWINTQLNWRGWLVLILEKHIKTCNQALNQSAQPAILSALQLHLLLYSLYYEVIEEKKESNKSDRLKSVLIPSQNHVYGADVELRKDWNNTLTSKQCLSSKKAQKFSGISQSKEIILCMCRYFCPFQFNPSCTAVSSHFLAVYGHQE